MATDNLYNHGLPFSQILADNLDDLTKRVELKKASLIIIDGGVGEGKTTMVIHVLDYFNKKMGGGEIDFKGCQLAMGGADFLRKIREAFEQKKVCIGYDEAGDFSKRGSLTGFNAMLNRTFETFRAFKCIVILSLPNFNVLDSQLFDNQIPRMLIHLHDRTKNEGNFAAYGLDEMNWLRYWMNKWPKHRSKAYGMVTPNFRGHFKDLPTERSKQLDEISTENKLKILRKSEIKVEGLVNYEELAIPLNRGTDWVMRALKQLNIKPARTIDRKKYFQKDVINILTDHLEEQEIGRPRTRGI